jgi:LysR family transcriptional regulator, regulator for metE and metH
MIERSLLEIIREVGRSRTLTDTAATMHLSQSALSHAVRKFEQQTGTRIWKKKGRLLQLTDAGKFLLDLANSVLPQFEHAESVINRFAGGKKGVLRIGMECHPCYQWLLKAVFPYLQQWPEVDVDIKNDFQFDGLNGLIRHEIDLLITPDLYDNDELQFTPVFAYEMVLVVAQNHQLAECSYITPADLKKEKLLTYPVEHERLDIFRNFLSPAHCRPAGHQVIEDSDIMIQMVAADRGVTALPDWLVSSYIELLPLKALRLGQEGLHKKLFTAVRKSDLKVDYISAFVDHAQQISAAPENLSR